MVSRESAIDSWKVSEDGWIVACGSYAVVVNVAVGSLGCSYCCCIDMCYH